MELDILAFGAHPDDVELTCGGTLIKAVQKGAKIGIVPLTKGEMGTRGSQELRAKEFDQAAEILGAHIHHCLDLPDGHLSVDENSKRAIVKELRQYRPKVVFLPYWEDRHPDHGNASRIIEEAAFVSGLRRIDTGQEPHRPAQLVYFMTSWVFEPSFVVDITDVNEHKTKAIMAYESQVHNKAYHRQDEEETYISSPQFMEMINARAAFFGHQIGKKFGEPFKIKTMMEIKDVLETFGDRVY